MNREYYLDLARSGVRAPIGTDLVLYEHGDAEDIVLDGPRLGRVTEDAARRYGTPLAIPLMDLRLEKADLLRILGIPDGEVDRFHFHEAPPEDAVSLVEAAMEAPFARRNQAHMEAIRYIARETDLLPVGMAIGPFSLMTKLVADPITPIAMAGLGVTASEDGAIGTIERCLRLAELAVGRSVRAQAEAGAKAILICEPAANVVYLSPKQIRAGSDIFERFVMQPNLRLKKLLAEAGADLIFHDCGQLNNFMVKQFAVRLDPAILSLGSSRKLWEDAALAPKHVVLYGNLPTKSFYSDEVMPVEKVESITRDLIERMQAAGHPHILGSECDVLHVPEAARTIRSKVAAMLACGRPPAKMVTRRRVIPCLLVGAPAIVRSARRPAADKPNLLFLWTDQQRADTLAAYGNSGFKVPVLNRLAEQSIVFLKTYDTQPVCTPARSSVMTGLWPHTNGCIANNIPLSRQALTMPELLGDPAYRTGYMGKWHLGDEVFAQHGFQEWVSIEEYNKYYAESRDQSARSTYWHFLEKLGYKSDHEDGEFSRDFASRLPIEHCKPAFLAGEASQFVARHKSEPWMLYVNFLEPHSPFSGPLNDLHGEEDVRLPAGYPGTPVDHEPELYRARRAGRNKKGKKDREVEDEPVTSREALIRKCRNYAGLCSQVDQAVGRILQALETSGQAERTVVVFTSDHGEMMGSHSLSGKNVLYEDAVRIPLLLRAPFRQQKPVRMSHPVSHIDVVPTLLELMGRPAPAFLQGESLMPLVRGGKRREQDVFIEWHTAPDGPHARTIVSPDGWKLVLFDKDHCLLFNRNNDPLEMQNLYYRSDSAQTIRQLQSRLEAWQRRTGDRLELGTGVIGLRSQSDRDVIPIDKARFSKVLPADPMSKRWQLLLNQACKETLTGWWMESQCRGHEGEYIDFGYLERTGKTDESGEETKEGIRPPSQYAYTVAAALATGAYDASLTGVSKEQATIRALTIIKSLAKDHLVNGGIGRPWGDHWQSAQWAEKVAVSAWLLWDHLDAGDRDNVRKMIEHEADRFLSMVPPAANEQYIKDTKAEENGWNATGIQAACALMPKHPRFKAWWTKAIEYRMTALATPKDRENTKVYDGRAVKDWTTGYNLDNLGALGNHRSYPHASYMVAPLRHDIEGTIYLALAGLPVPEANRFNCDLIYRNLVDHRWNDIGPIYRTDGSIYWPIAKEERKGQNYLTYALADAGALFLGYDRLATVKGGVWEDKHARKGEEAGLAEYTAASAYLLHWLAYRGVRFFPLETSLVG